MKKSAFLGFFFFAAAVLFIAAQTPRKITIYGAGDSTMANKDTTASKKERGWGMYLHEFFTDQVVIKNFAQNGRSTRTFREEGWWGEIMSDLHKGDYVIIEFGHNDDMPSKKSYTTPQEYRANLIRMIDEVKAKGGIPVLCTPVARRRFDTSGKLENTHTYPYLVREVAQEQKVLFIDMLQLTANWLAPQGEQATRQFFMEDNTHFVEAGARQVASLFVDALKALPEVKSEEITSYFLMKSLTPFYEE